MVVGGGPISNYAPAAPEWKGSRNIGCYRCKNRVRVADAGGLRKVVVVVVVVVVPVVVVVVVVQGVS